MAIVQVTYTWPDGSAITVAVSGKKSYPDALDQLAAQARKLYGELLATLPDAEVEQG